MELTVITRQRLFGHKPGSVIVVDDSPIVRGLLARNRLDLVDPPELPPLEEAPNGNESNRPETGADQELPEQPKRPRSKGPGKASAERPGEGEGTVPGSIRSYEELPPYSADDTEGEAHRSSDSEG